MTEGEGAPTPYAQGCLVCGRELEYRSQPVDVRCFYCGSREQATAACVSGHFVCDRCHSAGANDLIEEVCSRGCSPTGDPGGCSGASEELDPVSLALRLMRHPAIKMHGPEHHFLVPAVLLACYYNRLERYDEKADKVRDHLFAAYKDCQRMVRDGRWKLIWYPKIDRVQLFDLPADPNEVDDLSAKPAYAAKVAELRTLLAVEQKAWGDNRN